MGRSGNLWDEMGFRSTEKVEQNERLANPYLDFWSLALVVERERKDNFERMQQDL
jgi:hypothetical protein